MHGLPRSGKSTLTARLRKLLGAPVVKADAVRLALHGQRYQALAESFVKAIRMTMVRALFEAGHDIVLYDETNFSRAARDSMKSDKWETRYVHVPTSPEICKERAIATGQPDLLPVIDAMHARYEPLGDDELRYVLPDELEASLRP
jgi:predicted kinase